ncbi:hypothetical protein MmiEs2_00890 [Methanimicrococcus stummii]|uniref:Uncharacterized protein n=1 Tax=Methanimicrococcus stummii TaxID=3028294 RepID=A0AA96V8V0_9EURY|nr:hypothetical protein [Methanimicrococcus sp. Es2]WNY27910.1 hypothetical protein MmiEs2_00890 [Methanimicrococcus sp. Es2]
MDYEKLRGRLLYASVFSIVAGGVFSAVGIYTGGLEMLFMPEAFLNFLTIFGIIL